MYIYIYIYRYIYIYIYIYVYIYKHNPPRKNLKASVKLYGLDDFIEMKLRLRLDIGREGV